MVVIRLMAVVAQKHRFILLLQLIVAIAVMVASLSA